MTNDERIYAKIHAASRAADHIREAMKQLHFEQGLPWDSVIAGAHSEVISAMTATFGGAATADSCERAAERVRSMPSLSECALAVVTPAGHA